ncbi:sensor histidine kinase [Paenibacillus frigoriresistens]|uniref:cache domain-containing sensor histidine kinase n=1 Tax=Paenibacillus alginolyticus TaxID=59839 RepID=UPI001563D648|nr:sensor histidine kinase [Paenibacillus frigoriresistens]NRF96159.1 sensor histidine kinase [Paenibacillus frigoriresistens]
MKFIRILKTLLHMILNKKSIQSQLLLTFIFITLIPILLVGYMTFRVSSSTVTEEVKRGNGQLMQEIERNLLTYFRLIEIDSQSYASRIIENNIQISKQINYSNVYLLENVKKINDELFSTFDSNGGNLSIRAFSDDGEFISSAFDRNTNLIYSYRTKEDMEWRRSMFENRDDRLLFDVHPIETNELLSLTASQSVFNPFSGKRIGYISYDKKMETFAGMFQPFEERPDSRIQLVKKDGKILYHTDRDKIGAYADQDWLNAMERVSETTAAEQVTQDQNNMILIRSLPSIDSYIIGTIPLSYVNKQRGIISNVTLLASLLAVFLIGSLSLLLSMYISRPIKQLSKTMQQVERGQMSIQVPTSESSLETMLLSRSFESMLSRINNLMKTQYEMEIHKKDAELKALMMQINPHFLYNTLEVISGMAEEVEADRISEITQALSKMLRYNIDLKSDKARIAEEVENSMYFLAILKYRFEERLQIETDIDPNALPYQVVKTILQPLIENAVKYGVEKKLGQAFIYLRVKKHSDMIQIEVTDNGVGFDPEYLEQFNQYISNSKSSFYEPTTAQRIGLKNVYKRMYLVYDSKLAFTIKSTPESGSIIDIRFPAIFMNNNLGGQDGQ